MNGDAQPGDLVFCHTNDFVGRAIRFGERLRFRPGSFFNHVAIVDSEIDDSGDYYVIQANAQGVTDTKTMSSLSPEHAIVQSPFDADVDWMLEFAYMQVGQRYGWLSCLSIALKILLPRWFPLPTMRRNSTWICSALGAETLRAGGWLVDWPDIYTVVPSELCATITGISLSDLALSWRLNRKL